MAIQNVEQGPAPQSGQDEARASSKLSARLPSKPVAGRSNIDIIDIRRDAIDIDLKKEILASLKPAKGPKTMPTLLLYDEKGLQLFEEITYLDEYYLTNAEIDVLKTSATQIVQHIQPNSMIVELGSGNLRKVSILLQALEDAAKNVDYYALDLAPKELQRTLAAVPEFKHVKCHGLHGTYDDGLAWLKSNGNASRPKCILSLGSSIGNFHRHEAASFLKGFSEQLRPCDSMLVGLDACNDSAKVFHAYNDREGLTHRFVLNGLEHANQVLGENVFILDDWKVIGEYVYDIDGGRHQAFYSPRRDVIVRGIQILQGERVQVEQSLKYTEQESHTMWDQAGLNEVARWSASKESYNLHLLTKSAMTFSLHPAHYAAKHIPTIEDWRGLWAVWDTVTRGMIRNDELLNKPIKLRNACIFYLGHIPVFLDMQLVKATGEALCEPSYYPKIFERGIDPDVDNPELCHDHSEIPDEWPPLEEILAYGSQVRAKIERMYKTGTAGGSRKIDRSLFVGFEHEIMHLETLLYMLLQSDRTLPPPGTARPDFEKQAVRDGNSSVPNEWFVIPEQEITIGLEDPEDNSGDPTQHFGWDNEKPIRKAVVPSFRAQGRPITNEEYARYLEATRSKKLPASWVETKKSETNGHVNGHTNGYTNGHNENHLNGTTLLSHTYPEGKAVRTVYGPVPLKHALHWPVFASYDELAGCAKWMGGRIPTFEEARSMYSYAEFMKMKEAEKHLSKTVPAVNAHLLNDGVEESPPSRATMNGESSPELFANLESANVGFAHWNPVAVTANGNKLAGQAEMGGVWEWTSTPLSKWEGFEAMPLYPGYTADFFDGKHNIVLGGSWATHPRVAGRKTFVNWYQRNYPYAWCGARLVKDL